MIRSSVARIEGEAPSRLSGNRCGRYGTEFHGESVAEGAGSLPGAPCFDRFSASSIFDDRQIH